MLASAACARRGSALAHVPHCISVIRSQHAPRGILILPGLGNNAADYAPLSQLLTARGYTVATAPITRPDWSRNALALTDGELIGLRINAFACKAHLNARPPP